jgi:UDP-3-O-[3-hydroxymyristoyl] glucosamine N-acyltransferase
MSISYKISELASMLGGRLYGDGEKAVKALNSIALAGDGDITFAGEKKYFSRLKDCKASAVIISEKVEEISMPQIVVANVDNAIITVLGALAPQRPAKSGIHQTALVSEGAQIGKNVYIGAFVFVDDGAIIGDDTIIENGSSIGYNTAIGKNCRIDANVAIYNECRIGNNCIIQSGAVIGGTGFGYRPVNNMPQLIPHYGGVVIEDFVEIGANTCIDRAKFGDTVIGFGTKIDNLVQIAHNCKIGKCCLIAAQVGLAGSCEFGDGVIVGGQGGATDHVKVASGATLAGRAVATSNIDCPAVIYGFPGREIGKAMKAAAEANRLPRTVQRIKELEKRVAQLEKTENN